MSRSKLETAEVLIVEAYRSSVTGGPQNPYIEDLLRKVSGGLSHEPKAIAEFMAKRGWVNLGHNSREGKITMTLTPLGVDEAVRLLRLKMPKTFLEKLHDIRWATWGGIAAIIGAFAAIIGAVFAYQAIQ